MNRAKRIGLILCILSIGFFPGPAMGQESLAAGIQDPVAPLRIVVSLIPQEYIVKQLTGDLAGITVLIPPGANPHTFEPSPSQLMSIAEANLYVAIGHPELSFEQTLIKKIQEQNKKLVIVESFKQAEPIEEDPHVWTSLLAVRASCAPIVDALATLDPSHADSYKQNLTLFTQKLDESHAKLTALFTTKSACAFLVFHPAWGYFARDYGLKQIAIEHEGKEPGPGMLTDTIKMAKAAGIKMIIVQPQSSQRSAEVIAKEISGTIVTLDPLAPQWFENILECGNTIAQACMKETKTQ